MCCLDKPKTPDIDSPVPIDQTEKVDELEPFTEQEQVVLDVFKAQWFGRADGYKGTTYSDAALFCNNVAGMELCPIVAYCPNGPVAESVGKPLFLQLPAFEGEQWSPVIADYDGDDVYVLTGTINGNPTTTCHTYRHFHDGKIPQWGIDGSEPEKKLYTLCCKDPSYVSEGIKSPAVDLTLGGPDITDAQMEQEGFSVEDAIAEGLKPIWLGLDDGWLGGSHSDGEWFCSGLGKQLCPYAGKLLLCYCFQLSIKYIFFSPCCVPFPLAYCPHGPGQPISSGHTTDISDVQWAPVFGSENYWVMVGMKHGNSATTCFTHEDLEGGEPSWGLSTDNHEIKQHIMCCDASI